MSKALEAARDAIVALRFSDTPHGPDEYARAAITAYHRAIAEDDGALDRAVEAYDSALEPETGETDWGGPRPTPTPKTRLRHALRELEPKE